MSEHLTPGEQAAVERVLADAVECGLHGEEALRYADATRGTLQFQGRALGYALRDCLAALPIIGRRWQ